MDKQQLDGLHALFLSDSRLDWELAAAMCSDEAFEAVMDMEVERMGDDIWTYEKFDERDNFSWPWADQVSYRYKVKLLMGVALESDIDVCARERWVRFERDFWSPDADSYDNGFGPVPFHWSRFIYHNEYSSLYTSSSTIGATSGFRDYFTSDFEADLQALKSYWREQLKALKAA